MIPELAETTGAPFHNPTGESLHFILAAWEMDFEEIKSSQSMYFRPSNMATVTTAATIEAVPS